MPGLSYYQVESDLGFSGVFAMSPLTDPIRCQPVPLIPWFWLEEAFPDFPL